ncbi:MAG: MFS transporter [Pseudomonadota bacterium]
MTTPTNAAPSAALFTPVLIAGSIILMVSFGTRAGFGVFQIPIAEDLGWLRVEYSFAIAIQNLAWGIGQPVFGAIAEKFGNRRALLIGTLIYFAGMGLSAVSVTPEGHQFWSVLIGFGVSGTGFAVIFGMIGRTTSDENRSMALGLATAAGSVGQILGPPLIAYLLQTMHWSEVYWVLGVLVLALLLTLPFLKTPESETNSTPGEPMGRVVARALKDPSFTLIFLGFFSCGYQIGFFTAHFPALVTELCGPIDAEGLLASIGITTTSQLGAWAFGLIGFANIAGTIWAGKLGGRYSKKNLLAGIYAGRVVVCIVFVMFPVTPGTVLLFSALMGMLWLATVPLTSGLVGQIYGLRYMGTLYGIIFFSHQIGSFIGVWMGGAFYDAYQGADNFGGYELVWWIGIGVGAFSAIVHLPIKERPLDAAAA